MAIWDGARVGAGFEQMSGKAAAYGLNCKARGQHRK
jgi:hypothetical protein